MIQHYKVKLFGDEFVISGDFVQANSRIRFLGDDGWVSTPWQVADFRHRPNVALKTIVKWAACINDSNHDKEIEDAIGNTE